MDRRNPKPTLLDGLFSGLTEMTMEMAERKIFGPVVETPEEAVLSFVASAANAGAQRLEVRTQGNDLVLAHDGRPLRANEMPLLLQTQTAAPQLSRALNLHLRQEGGHVVLETICEGSGGVRTTFRTGRPPTSETEPLRDLQTARMTTRVVLVGTAHPRRLAGSADREYPEVRLIRSRCFLAPLDLSVMGQPVSRFTSLPESLVTATDLGRDEHRGFQNLALTGAQGFILRRAELSSQLKSIAGGICGVVRNATDAGWYKIEDGVARPMQEQTWPARTWGYLQLAEGATEGAALEAEERLIATCLAVHLFEQLSHLPTDRAEEALTFLESQRSTLESAGIPQSDQDAQYLALRQRYLPSHDPRLVNSRLELAASMERSGRDQEAEAIYRELLPVWESEAMNHFDKYRYEEGAAVWQRAIDLHERLGAQEEELIRRYLKLAEIGRDHRLGCAEPAYRRALALMRSTASPDPERLAETLTQLATVLRSQRVLTESLNFAEEAHRILLELRDGKETKELVPVLKLLSEIYDMQGDYGRSTEYEQKATLLRFRR